MPRIISIQEKINFARHLHLAIQSGLSLVDGLRLIAEQASSRRARRVYEGLIREINKGRLLAQSLKKQERTFGGFFIGMVEVGEKSGRLSENLLYLADELKKRKQLESKLKSALVYPFIVLVATIGIVLFLIFFILPKIIPILLELNVALPAPTRFLIAFVQFTSRWGWHLLGFIVLFLFGMKFLLRVPSVRFFTSMVVLRIPIVSRLVIYVSVAQLMRTLGLLLKSGLTITDALDTAERTVSHPLYEKALRGATAYVRRGEQLARYLVRERHLFPSMVAHLIRIGEDTGNLEANLLYLSDYYTEEVEDGVRTLTTLLEPLLLLFMGALVGFVAISIIMPVYKLAAPQF